jgi:cysteine desulfurase/selenocysteine lyase
MLNVSKTKKDFPIFESNPGLIYFDNAATSQKPIQVIKQVSDFYKKYNSNIHRGIYSLAEKATQKYEDVRKKTAEFINAKSNEIIFTKGTTESINLLSYSLGKSKFLEAGDNIVTTIMEHHSNFVPWQQLCKYKNISFRVIGITEQGNLDLEGLFKSIDKKTKLLAITQSSNMLGVVNPIAEIIKKAKSINPKIMVLIDAAQSIPHFAVNVKKLDCDFLAFSSHKMLGPTGVGVLYAKSDLLKALPPFLFGGEMIQEVSVKESSWNDIPYKFEAGTPNIAQVIGFISAIDYLEKIGLENIKTYEADLVEYALDKFKRVKTAKVYGPLNVQDRNSVISFNLQGVHPHDLAALLDKDNIAIRAGNHCTMPLHRQALGIEASARISFYFYNTKSEIDKFFDSLERVQKILKK